MSVLLQRSPHWPGFANIKHLFIFGASYCATSDELPNRQIIPTAVEPLGVPFPGEDDALCTKFGTPNWVGHLIAQYRPGPRYKPNVPVEDQDPAYLAHPLLVYNYSFGGSRAVDVINYQLPSFSKGAGSKPSWAPWTSEDSLFITWVGINDCAHGNSCEESMSNLFGAHEKLYEAGARNFVLINVPPIERSPAVDRVVAERASQTYLDWNTSLSQALSAFSNAHSDATTIVFSAHEAFTKILDNPEEYDLPVSDLRKRGGAIWVDHLHPTSAVHSHVARYLADFLQSLE
ncbi:hypothetical protein CPB85DRAFT_1556235 [Mucidula mucida]|nr:hypothetical protein CPB85DRAFT_1556235 [Mucidula mucida]